MGAIQKNSKEAGNEQEKCTKTVWLMYVCMTDKPSRLSSVNKSIIIIIIYNGKGSAEYLNGWYYWRVQNVAF